MRTLFVLACWLACSACAAEEIVAATLQGHPDGGPLAHPKPPPCSSNADCRPEEFCSKQTCQDTAGTCAHKPIFCGTSFDPFCGCDGITYYTDCLRRFEGVAASTPGECDLTALDCGGPMQGACPAPSLCGRLVPTGPVARCPPRDPVGKCWDIPTDCGPRAAGDSWMPCGPPAACVDACTAIRSGVLHWYAPGCP